MTDEKTALRCKYCHSELSGAVAYDTTRRSVYCTASHMMSDVAEELQYRGGSGTANLRWLEFEEASQMFRSGKLKQISGQ